MSLEQPNAVAENEAVAAKLKALTTRADNQPISYKMLFDQAHELAGEQLKRAMAAEAAVSCLLEAARSALTLLEKGAPGWGVAKDELRSAIAKLQS